MAGQMQIVDADHLAVPLQRCPNISIVNGSPGVVSQDFNSTAKILYNCQVASTIGALLCAVNQLRERNAGYRHSPVMSVK
jgi:hypothetical protein